MGDETGSGTTARGQLAALIGEWTGTYRLWLQPDVLRTESATHCVGRPVLDGQFVALDYEWSDLDGPQLGSMLVGHNDEGGWELLWVDSWHTRTAMMFCVGDAPIDVLGSYGPKGDEWGWRTRIDAGSDELLITAWNVTPDGDAAKATEARYARVR